MGLFGLWVITSGKVLLLSAFFFFILGSRISVDFAFVCSYLLVTLNNPVFEENFQVLSGVFPLIFRQWQLRIFSSLSCSEYSILHVLGDMKNSRDIDACPYLYNKCRFLICSHSCIGVCLKRVICSCLFPWWILFLYWDSLAFSKSPVVLLISATEESNHPKVV